LTAGEISLAGVEPLGGGAPDLDQALGALAADEDANATLLALRRAYPAPDGWTRRQRVPFSSARKWSAASFEGHGSWVLGAPEMVWPGSGPDDAVSARAEQEAATGSRTLLVATTDQALSGDALPAGLRPIALVRFDEAIRPDAPATLRYFTEQGVGLKVISGDNPRTVGAVAERVGLPGAGQAVDARQLPDEAGPLAEVVDARSVFGRVTPQQKRAMVGVLQARDHVVAMTGDGVNDALALKDADIGVAMGGGAAATRAVAQLVLLESQFSVLPGVVAEGRRVIGNIERVANLFLTKNVSALLLSLSVAVAGWPFPFLPRHLTLVSALAIGIPGFFLALGPSTTRFETGFVRRVLSFAVPAGTIIAVAVMIAYGLARAEGVAPDRARTAATIAYTVASLWVLVMQARPLRTWKLALVATMAGLAFLSFALPRGRSFFDLRLPPPDVVLQSLALGAAACVAMEAASRLAGRIRLHRSGPSAAPAGAPGGAAPGRPGKAA
jgi:cation-transporting ATPase E